ncbi:MAG: allophanate hydrolase [Burkholderiaceae bacterium]|nr:allophanate hydrolase [Burkholderiaceae bacterium]
MNLPDNLDLTIASLQQRYAQATLTPSACITAVLSRIEQASRPEVWINRVTPSALTQRTQELDSLLAQHGAAVFATMPLFGVPFAVKDNIDVAGMPTTVACPGFTKVPEHTATVVSKLLAAGAILVGKTNLDQFATGLVGTRSPYGAVRNAHHPERISGGSSSGSAVAVALGLVSFALGTDTAGSGRVPAGLNGIVGLKPTRGLLSTHGVFPACRTLDCVSVFAQDVADAWRVTRVASGFDAGDSYSRHIAQLPLKTRGWRAAVPAQPEFYGDTQAQQAFAVAMHSLHSVDKLQFGEIDYTPFRDAAALLYQGPWVAERLAAVGDFIDSGDATLNPVVAGIIAQGKDYSAVDAFHGQYRLAELKRQAEQALREFDFLIVPTAPTFPTQAEVAAHPVARNSELGCYTNFVNFFDMAALAIPAAPRGDGLPFGITLIGRCGSDHMLAHAAQTLLGTLQAQAIGVQAVAEQPLPGAEPCIQVAVVGAHLSGQPLNWQLQEAGARQLQATHTAAHYRLYALSGTVPPKPGLARVATDGKAIAVEVWEMPLRHFGNFVAQVPPPLGIGTVELADGSSVKGFLCEPLALQSATDITQYGGWRAYLARTAVA